VCRSDLHVLRSEWNQSNYGSLVCGHEIVGHAVRVGDKVKSIKVGDRVGVGASSWSCGECAACKSDNEQYCKDQVETYNFFYKQGWPSYGGYANYARVHENFVFPIPDGLDLAIAAPMLCGGLTMYSPLTRAGVTKGSKVGFVGLGGLGHFGVMFAKAMGAEVTVISHSPRKRDDAMSLGATNFITGNDYDKDPKLIRSLDLIISANSSLNMQLEKYLTLLKVGGTYVQCGLPDGDLPSINPFTLIMNNVAIRGSNIGSKAEAIEMLQLAKDANVKSWIEIRPMSECSQVVQDLDDGKARYRYVLKQDIPE
jgi:alcohol dehydrogenase (NADP+)